MNIFTLIILCFGAVLISAGPNKGKYGGKKDCPRCENKHSLHEAAKIGTKKCIQHILETCRIQNIDTKNDDGQTALYTAAQNNRVDVVKILIKNDAKIDCKTDDGRTPIYIASYEGHERVVRILIERGADVNVTAKNGYTPLHAVAQEGKEHIAELLLKRGTDVNHQNSDNETALHIALKYGKDRIVEFLLKHGANVHIRNNDGETALHMASKYGKHNIVRSLIRKGSHINSTNISGQSPIYIASLNGHHRVVRVLIDEKADVNNNDRVVDKSSESEENDKSMDESSELEIIENDKTMVPLIAAAERGCIRCAELLLQNGASVSNHNEDGESALHVASKHDKPDIVEVLIKKDAEINLKNCRNETAIFVATLAGHEHVVKILIEENADVNIRDKNGWAPINAAAEKGHLGIAELLLHHKADVNNWNNNGENALHMASRNEKPDMVELLINNGAKIDLKNDGGETPIYIASCEGKERVVEKLINKGANVSIADKKGYTPLHVVARKGIEDIVEILIAKYDDVDIPDGEGNSPLHAAVDGGYEKIVEILLRKGAKINLKNNKNETPKDIADKSGDKNIKELLETIAYVRPSERACKSYINEYKGNRIVNGVEAKDTEFPWMAALEYNRAIKRSYEEKFLCGGTVISRYFILTAAHCVLGEEGPKKIRLGKVSLIDGDKDSITAIDYNIKNITKHPDHCPDTKKNDIALIEVEKRIEFSNNVRPACLHTDLRDEPSEVKLTVSGWGRTSYENNEQSTTLKKTQLNTVSISECNALYKKETVDRDSEDEFFEGQYCAYEKDTDSCQGDSGGPLQYFNNETSVGTVVAIVSHGSQCATKLPGVYTRVSFYLEWIEKIVWKNESMY